MRSKTTTLVSALRILAAEIQSDDGIARAAILEAADRMAELRRLLKMASGQMSYGHWSRDFRDAVEDALK